MAKRNAKAREAEALDLLRHYVTPESRPIVFWSSGKDSMVAAHLTLRLKRVPMMWWRLPPFQEKQRHGNWVARLWDLELYDMSPSLVQEYQHEGFFEVFHVYRGTDTGLMFMSTGIVPYPEQAPYPDRYLCAIEDLLLRPKGLSEFPWDVAIQGQKSCDESYVGQRTEILEPAHPFGTTTLVNPLHNWSDGDVWAYIKRYDLPIDRRRYVKHDQTTSPDHYPTCFRCLDTRVRGEPVLCPKRGSTIRNVAKSEAEHGQFLDVLVRRAAHLQITGSPRTTMGAHV